MICGRSVAFFRWQVRLERCCEGAGCVRKSLCMQLYVLGREDVRASADVIYAFEVLRLSAMLLYKLKYLCSLNRICKLE